MQSQLDAIRRGEGGLARAAEGSQGVSQRDLAGVRVFTALRRADGWQIPRNLKMLYLHSYQAFLWNHMASERVRLFGFDRVVPGDLVAPEAGKVVGIDEGVSSEEQQQQQQQQRVTGGGG